MASRPSDTTSGSETIRAIPGLTAYTSDDFDTRFMEQQAKGHKEDVALFEQVAAKATDKDVKEFAQNNLPTLREHLQMAPMESNRLIQV